MLPFFLAEACSIELEGCNSVSTPGTKETVDSIANDGPLVKEAETSFQSAAARSNYFSIDRPDCEQGDLQTDDNTDAKVAPLSQKTVSLLGWPAVGRPWMFPHSKEHFRWHHHLGKTRSQRGLRRKV